MPGDIKSWPPLSTITQIPRRLTNCPALAVAGCVHSPGLPLCPGLSLSAPEAASPRLLLTSHRAHCHTGGWSPATRGPGAGGTGQMGAQEKQVHCENLDQGNTSHQTSLIYTRNYAFTLKPRSDTANCSKGYVVQIFLSICEPHLDGSTPLYNLINLCCI